jgi:hypothetical protein
MTKKTQKKEGEKPKKKKLGIVALKHKVVLDKLQEKVRKGEKPVLRTAMVEAGYSQRYANTGEITKKKSWAQLMEQYLPDDLLSQTHSELLVAKKLDYMLFGKEVPDVDIYELMSSVNCVPKKLIHGIQGTHVYFWSPDNKSRKDATELAYKIKGKMVAEKVEITGGLHSVSDEELAAIIAKESRKLAKKD